MFYQRRHPTLLTSILGASLSYDVWTARKTSNEFMRSLCGRSAEVTSMNLNFATRPSSKCSTPYAFFSSFSTSSWNLGHVCLGCGASNLARPSCRSISSVKSHGRTSSKGAASVARSTPAPKRAKSKAKTPPARIIDSTARRSLLGSMSSAFQKFSTAHPEYSSNFLAQSLGSIRTGQLEALANRSPMSRKKMLFKSAMATSRPGGAATSAPHSSAAARRATFALSKRRCAPSAASRAF
mmetsp:Transcript_70942/g.217420  ORF Transcript_70942/g.217420 Transcript_70942/m.217420 type:complete len:239 (+) Transcript_70942:159-875(+)